MKYLVKTTPQPWRIEQEKFGQINIVGADGYGLASIPDPNPDEGGRGDEDTANAKLLGCAPPMLRLLKQVIWEMDHGNLLNHKAQRLHILIEQIIEIAEHKK